MKRSRRNHSAAFKAKVALQAIRGDNTLAELAQQHQVHAPQIGAWKQQLLEHAAELFANGQSLAEDSQERVQELHAKIGELTMERDFSYGPRCQASQGLFSPCGDESVAGKYRIGNAGPVCRR